MTQMQKTLVTVFFQKIYFVLLILSFENFIKNIPYYLMKKYNEKEFEEKIEQAVDKYLAKKAQQQASKGYISHNNECIIDKLVEKEKMMTSIANIFTEMAKITCLELIAPIKNQLYQLEEDLGKVKELVIKSFSNATPMIGTVAVEKVLENGKQIEIEELERIRKKLNNHDNMINLLMDTHAQMKQAVQVFNNSENIQEKLLSQFDERIYELKQELNDTRVNDTVRQVKEKCNACWVVLGDVNDRVEKMQKYLDEQTEKKRQGGLFQKAASYIKST